MKKIRIIGLVLLLCLALSLVGMVFIGENAFSASAVGESFIKVDDASVANVTYAIFGDKQIKSSEYLYNYDDSSDFIYVDFEDYGYAVFFKTTMELMEYSPYGSLPYDNSNEKRYYGGPANYIQKDGEQFKNIVTGESILISTSEAKNFSSQMRQAFLSNDQEKRMYDLDVAIESNRTVSAEEKRNSEIKGKNNSDLSGPDLDDANLVPAAPPGSSGSTYISNADYFTTRPVHGINAHGTCGSVAAQLLLSYNNFYNDRRIIAPEHLNGGWNNSTGDNNMFNPANYTNRANSPNACIDPNSKTAQTLGTNNDFYNHVIGAIEPGAFTCTHTTNPDGTINHSHNGSSTNDVRNGLRTVLGQRIAANQFTVDSHTPFLDIGSIGESGIKGEINAGRPTVLLMQQRLGGSNHFVVAYGYQNYTYPGTSSSYSGYVVHFGWTGNDTTDPSGHNSSVWVNSSWVYSYISMELTHTHNYNIDTGNIINNTHREVRCGECGHRTVDELYNISGNTITSPRYPLTGSITIPSVINGTSITAIGNSAFANQSQLSQITIPASVTSIGYNAFKNCTSLTTVNFESPSSLTSIGASAFAGCTQLSQITIPSGVTSIGASAFAGCTQLSQISLPSSIESIGMEAFVPGISLTGYGGDGTNINLIIVDGTKQSFVDNGWTGFNIVELSATGPLTVTSGQLKGEIGIPTYFNNRMIETIGENAFAGQAELTGITLPTSVTSIGASAFANCAELEYATYFSITGLASTPNQTASFIDSYYTERDLGIQLIQDYTYRLSFYYSNLTATTDISNVFTSLGVGENSFTSELQAQKAFSSSSGKQVIVFTPTAEQLATSKKLWCRFIKTETPQSVSIDISNIEVNVGMRDIDISSFVGCEKLASPGLAYGLLPNGTYAVSGLSNDWQAIIPVLSKTLFIPSYHNGVEVTQIDADAFANEDRIKWVFVQSKISTIGNGAFQNCTNLETVNLSATAVTRIENKTFDSCALGAFSFPSNLTYIGADAFIRAGTVKNMPDSVTTIGDYAFAYRPDAIGAYLPNNLYSIGAYAFAYCDDFLLTNENTGLTIIGPFAFCNTKLTANTQIPEYVTTIGESAFMDSGFSANFAFPVRNRIASIGHRAFRNCGLTRIVLPTTITTIGNEAFNDNANLTVYTNFNSRPAGWSTPWNGSERPVVWGCTLASTRTFVVSFTKTASNPTNTNAPNGITQPYRSGYSFGGWYTASDYSGTQYMDMTTAPNGTLYAKWTENSCVAEGTLITLADGSQVAVEDLSGEDNLLVWNMLTGQFDSAPILFIDSDPYTEYEITHLYFSDGTEVKIIDEHGFWNISQNQYVFLRNDAGKYIGNWFNKQSYDSDGNMIYTAVQLIDVNVYNEYTTAWSPVTYGHLCYYVNGMLSMPGATEGLINIFEVNGTTMQYDTEAFAADIATYGLFTYEEFAELIPITEEVFNAFNGQYLKISIGKGLIGMDGIVALVERYAPFLQTDEDVTPNTESEINNGRQNRGNHYGWNNDNLHGHNGRNKGIGHQD